MYRRFLPQLIVLLITSTLIGAEPLRVASPDGDLAMSLSVSPAGEPVYQVTRRDHIIASGSLGLEFAGSGSLDKNLKIVSSRQASHDQTYSVSVGKASTIRNHYHELTVGFQEQTGPHRRFDVAVRAFDDAIAFRYVIPEQKTIDDFILTAERTRFQFGNDSVARILPLNSYTTSYEAYYQTLPPSQIGPEQLVGLPLLVEQPIADAAPVWVAITEANLTDYAGLYLTGTAGDATTLSGKLSPLPGRADGAKVIGTAPHTSPWRVMMISNRLESLIESNVVFNLNEPSKIEDTSWIKPGMTTFPWWNHFVLGEVDFEPGVNTATMKHYIDFCAESGIPYHSLDGLDIAWYGGPIFPSQPTDVTTAAPSIDLDEVIGHAKQKGVRLRVWVHWLALAPQLDEAFAAYEKWGIEGVMIDFMDRDDQEMVRWYHEVAEKAAKHHLTVTWHGAYKPTGMERTWPNVLSYEAVLNQEYNKWEQPGGKGTPPAHNLNAAFIRMLAGPLDYHQGGMRNVLPENYHFRDVAPPVQGTRAHQLAMYVVYQNHLPMLADFPAAYRGQPEKDFLVGIPSNWDEIRVLHAEIDHCIVVARRHGSTWYLGGMTADESRELQLPLGFLGEDAYDVDLYLDHPDEGPTATVHRERTVTKAERLSITLAPSGGFAGRLAPRK